MVDFNPNFGDEVFDLTENKQDEIATNNKPVIIIPQPNKDIVSISNLLHLTQAHIEDDKRCRDDINTLASILDDNLHVMSIKDILEYMKLKIREREFHVDCIFKTFQFIQKTELARELLAGSDRKERIIEATDRTRINKLLDMLNENSPSER